MVTQGYINGMSSSYYLADKYHVEKTTIQKWVKSFIFPYFICSNSDITSS